jgi:ABC-type sugar transport system permease subunit
MPGVVTGTIWLFLLDPSLGPTFTLLMDLGILDSPIYWQNSGLLSNAVIWLVGAWTFWPFAFLILVASRESIPKTYYESAKVYGASRIQMFWNITLPQMKTALIIVLSLRFVWNLAKISQPFTLTGGGPGWSTSLMAIFMYRLAWVRGSLGLAFAVGLILFIAALIPIMVFVRETEKEEQIA